MNQLFQQLNPQSSNTSYHQSNPILNMFKQCKMMADPVGYISNLPEMKQVMGLVNQNGGNAKQVFYQLAQQKGIDPNSILDMFK